MDSGIFAKAKAIKSEHKALGVVTFGYFRYRNARFGCAEVHQAIQCYGRAGMTRARQIAQEMGYEMVHAMTDCAFFHGPGITRADARRFSRRVSREVGVPMAVEGVYRWIVFLPSKVHSKSAPGTVGVPNRYYGKFEDGTLKLRGIEVQRHSTPPLIEEVQHAMLAMLAEADDVPGFHARLPQALRVAKDAADRLRARTVDPAELALKVQATKAVEDYSARTATQAALRRLRAAGTELRPGEYVRYVVTRTDGPQDGRVVPLDLLGEPGPFGTEVGYHVGHYLRLLARSVETLLSPFGYDEEHVLAWLSGQAERPEAPGTQRVDVPAQPRWVRA